MKTLIFADVHLEVGPSGEKTLKDFTQFLRQIDPKDFTQFLRQIDPKEFGCAIILGDLFDFWFEYRHVVFSDYFDVLRAFADLHERGMAFHLVCGNHDFWAGRFLEEHLGFTIHHDRYACILGDTRALFVHGDGTNPSDYGYRAFKYVARSPLAVRLFRLLHPDWAMGVAQRVSHSSRKFLSPDDPRESREVAAMRTFAEELLADGEADVVFCAHTHHPVEEEFPTPNGMGTYINTGDWMHHRTYLEWDAQGFHRKYYRAESGQGDHGPSEHRQ